MTADTLFPLPWWQLLTRLGEAQILVPAALLAALAPLRRAAARPLVGWWLALLGLAVLLTTASKVAFIGWGIGSARLDFTGISGHAMFASALYPLLFGVLASAAPRRARLAAVAGGATLALLVGVSRSVVGAHSASEVVAGLLLGGGVSGAALAIGRLPRGLVTPLVPALIALWLVLTPLHAPASRSHDVVTRLSLRLAGHDTPYVRSDLWRKLRRHETLDPGPT